MNDRKTIDKLKQIYQKNHQSQQIDNSKRQEKIDRNKRWIQFWRENPNLYIHFKMGFKSFAYQHFSYYLMGEATTYFDVSTRGVGKSLKAVTFGVSQCLLFPYKSVAVLAVGRSQSDADFETTFKVDVFKNSPFVSWLWDKGLITAKNTEKGYRVDFWNGSVMYFMPCIDSSRGEHVSLIIIEECRLIQKTRVDSIAIPMLTLRQPQYKRYTKYKDYKSKFDKMEAIYITSNRFKSEWFNTLFNQTFVGYFKDRYNAHRIFCSDIFLAIKHCIS